MIYFIHMMEIGQMIYIGYNRHSILIQMFALRFESDAPETSSPFTASEGSLVSMLV